MPTYYFFDSSALVKHYHTEPGTEEVERIFNDGDAVLCIGRLTLVETPSAFAKKVRIGELRLTGFTAACQRLNGDVVQQRLRVYRLTESHYQTAERLVKKYGPDKDAPRLRSLDALQLSGVLARREHGKLDWFVTADGRLSTIATLEQLPVINPEEHSSPPGTETSDEPGDT